MGLCREVKDFIKFLPQRLAIGLTLHERLKAPPPSPYRGIRFKARPVTGFDFLICKQGQAITVDRKGTHPACSHSFKHFRPDGIMHRAILFGSAGFELHCPSAPYRQDASRKRIFAPNPASKPCSFPGATESLKVPPMRAEMRTEPIPYPLVRSTSTLQKSDVSWSISASPIHDAPPGARRSPLAVGPRRSFDYHRCQTSFHPFQLLQEVSFQLQWPDHRDMESPGKIARYRCRPRQLLRGCRHERVSHRQGIPGNSGGRWRF